MDLFPAIDIRFGRAVRLAQGAAATARHDDDPVALAERFVMQGARWLHLVDLDHAFGDGENGALIGRIITRSGATSGSSSAAGSGTRSACGRSATSRSRGSSSAAPS